MFSQQGNTETFAGSGLSFNESKLLIKAKSLTAYKYFAEYNFHVTASSQEVHIHSMLQLASVCIGTYAW